MTLTAALRSSCERWAGGLFVTSPAIAETGRYSLSVAVSQDPFTNVPSSGSRATTCNQRRNSDICPHAVNHRKWWRQSLVTICGGYNHIRRPFDCLSKVVQLTVTRNTVRSLRISSQYISLLLLTVTVVICTDCWCVMTYMDCHDMLSVVLSFSHHVFIL